MKYPHRFSKTLLLIILPLSFFITGCNFEDSNEQLSQSIAGTKTDSTTDKDKVIADDDSAEDDTDNTEDGGLDATEASHLTFMREEEKLARDVYLTLAELYPNQNTFNQIATRSEQTHTDTMRDRLDHFDLPDPNPDTNNLPDSLGIFTGDEWGWYFTEKFTLLTTMAEESEIAALYVGALIEELDMHDIVVCPDVMIERGYSSPCGLQYTDEPALQTAYSALVSGSENHLRAYVGKIEAVEGVGNYKAQYLTQEEVDAILGR